MMVHITATNKRYADATAYLAGHIRHCALSATHISQEAHSVLDAATSKVLEYRHLCQGPDKATWTTSLANDLGQLAQGVGTRMPTGTDTIFFIPKSAMPRQKKVTYGQLVSSI